MSFSYIPQAHTPILPPTGVSASKVPGVDELLDKGIALHQAGEIKPAMEIYHTVLRKDPSCARALYFTSVALSQLGEKQTSLETTLDIMRGSMKELQKIPEAHYNLGIMLHRCGLEEEALESFKKAVSMLDTLVEARTSLGGAYLNTGDRLKGEYWLRKAATTKTKGIDSFYSRAFARLTIGDWFGGWEDYDYRWRTASFLIENKRKFPGARHWMNGYDVKQAWIYCHTEQGAGDMIMFSRYLRDIKRRSNGRLLIEVGMNVVDVLRGCEGVDDIIATGQPVPAAVGPVSWFLPMMGMMRQLAIIKPKDVTLRDGWLPTPDDRFDVPVPRSEEKVNIGIAWAGSKAHKNDRYRSIPWELWRDHLLLDPRFAGKVRWFSFQVGENARDCDARPADLDLIDLTPPMRWFAHTARALQKVDLLVACDTATIHTAAALKQGPMSYVAIPSAPDWRWGLHGDTTPWYTRMRLFRQQNYHDWVSVVRAMADRVAEGLTNPDRRW